MNRHLFIVVFLTAAAGARSLLAQPTAPTAGPGITLVDIHLHGALPKATFDELGRQAGVKFTDEGGVFDPAAKHETADVDLEGEPFWSAVNKVCDLWNLEPETIFLANAPDSIVIAPRQTASPRTKLPTFQSGGFMIQAVSLSRNQMVNFGTPPGNHESCTINLVLYCDPSVNVTSVGQLLKAEEAVDDEGQTLIAETDERSFFRGNQKSPFIKSLELPLKFPGIKAKRIETLKFKLAVTCTDAVETVTIDNPLNAKEVSQKLGSATIMFHSLTKAEGSRRFDLKLGVNAVDAGRPGPMGLYQGQLFDEKGNILRRSGGSGKQMAAGLVEYTFHYSSSNLDSANSVGDPVKWVLSLPTKTHSIAIPVELKDLELP